MRLLRDPALLAVLLATLAGAALRWPGLARVPPAPNVDEVANGYDAYSLARTGRDHHGHPFPLYTLESYGDWGGSVLTWLTAPAVGLAGPRIEAVRGVSATLGVVAIPVLYGLGKVLFGRTAVGVAAAWYLAVSPWAVHRSRFAIPPSLVPTMVALTLLMLVWAVRARRPRAGLVGAMLAGLTVATYQAMRLYVPLLLGVWAWLYRDRLLRWKRDVLALAALAFLVTAGPVYYLAVADPDGRTRWNQVSLFRREHVTARTLVRQYRAYVSPRVFLLSGNGHPAQTPTPPGKGVELLSMVPLLVAGGVSLVLAVAGRKRLDRRPARLLLWALVLYPVPGVLTVGAPHLGRAAHVIPLLALLAGLGGTALWDAASRLRRRLGEPRGPAVLVGLGALGLGIVVLELGLRYRDYFTEYARRPAVLWYFQYGLADALAYARARRAEYDVIWVTGANQGYMYELFHGRWSPSDVHHLLQVRRSPGRLNAVEGIGMYRFGAPSTVRLADPRLLHTVRDPTGRVTCLISSGRGADGKRAMVIEHLWRPPSTQ